MMRPSSGSCTSFSPGCDVKYLARELLCSRAFIDPVRSPCGSRRTGTCVGGTPGRVRTCKPVRARELEPRACADFATGADSPCLLVKGADCAGVTRARGACGGPGLVCRCWVLLCWAVSRRTALFSCCPRANRAGVRGSFWCYQTRASDSKWSGSVQETMSLTNGGSLLFLYHSARASSAASASAIASKETRYFPSRL